LKKLICDDSSEQTMEKPKARLTRRTCLLFALLAIFVVIAVISRHWLAAIPNAQARKCLTRRDEEGALGWLEFSRRLSDHHPETEFLLGRVYRRQGKMDLVREHLLRAADLGWPREGVDREQWLALAQSGQMEAAEPHLVELLQDPRGDAAEICEAYVIGSMKMHYLGIAEKLLDVWIQDFPEDSRPYYLRGVMHRNASLFNKAERDLRRALDIEPGDSAAALSLAETLYEQGRAEQAVAFFQSAESGPNEAAARIGRARCLRSLGRPEEARRLLEGVLSSSRMNTEALVELARLDVEGGDHQAAIDRLGPVAEKEARNREFRFVLGTALRRVGRNEEARAHLEYTAEAGRELDRAARLILQVAKQPRDADLRQQIGRIHLDYGLRKDGVTWLESALECDPGHKPSHGALADYYGSKIGEGSGYAELAERHRTLAGKGDSPTRPFRGVE